MKRRLLAAAGLLLGLGGAEWTLRALGRALYRPPLLAPDSGWKPLPGGIWCLGDSHTQGSGAGRGEGWPERLQRRLAAEGRPAAVMNLGVGGTNSSQQLALLEEALRSGTPATVFYLGGSNDLWSLVDADEELLLRLHGRRGALYARLQRSRLFRVLAWLPAAALTGARERLRAALAPPDSDMLADLLKADRNKEVIALLEGGALTPQHRFFLAGAYLADRRYEDSARLFAELAPVLDASDGPVDPRLLAAESARLAGAPPAGSMAAFAAVTPDPARPRELAVHRLGRGWAALALGRRADAERDFAAAGAASGPEGRHLEDEARGWAALLAGEDARAAALFRKATAAEGARFLFGPPMWAWLGQGWLAARRGDAAGVKAAMELLGSRHDPRTQPLARRWLEALGRRLAQGRNGPALPPLRPSQSALHQLPVLHFLAHSAIDRRARLLNANLERMLRLSRERGFRLVLLTYPRPVAGINAALRDFARSRGLPLVDLEAEGFDVSRRTELLAHDGVHPNAAGYALIAARVQAELP